LLAASAALAPLTMFLYLGLESATVPAGDVRDPERTIPRATLLGIGVSSLLYVLGTIVVLGVVPREQLVNSTAPFADVARLMWGSRAAVLVTHVRPHLVAKVFESHPRVTVGRRGRHTRDDVGKACVAVVVDLEIQQRVDQSPPLSLGDAY
jgi:hypothetical protein